ncbi:hypothetical protein C8R46DRAFT_1052738 [Mycena filopes]|nr:hypothetical protein C8R46DRAFT_1052738 [Mycena filopes]
MSLLPFSLLLLVLALPMASGQDDTTTHIDSAMNSKVAITGAIIGGVLLLLALIAVAVYCIERCIRRRRDAKFTPVPTQSAEAEPYQYLSMPPRRAKDRGSYYPATSSPLASPDGRRSSRYASPVRNSGARASQVDTYGHGPYYPGPSVASPPASPDYGRRASSPGAGAGASSPMTPSFRVPNARSSLYQDIPTPNRSATTMTTTTTTSSSSLPRTESGTATLSRATTTTLNSTTAR